MHYVIIGNGVAGITAAFALRSREARAQITVIGGESEYFFSRTALMYAFMDALNLRDLEPFERYTYVRERIELVMGWVQDLDAARHMLQLADGREIAYDRLLIATGSVPHRLAWPGLDLVQDGVVHFTTLQNLAECERLVPYTRQAVVVGGGLIGVELAECLVHHGIGVDFVVREPWYWPMALAEPEGEIVAAHIRRHGVNLLLEHEVSAVTPDSHGRIASLTTNKGVDLPCQMLGICIGVRPSIDWLKKVTTPPQYGRGVVVNSSFQTSLPDIYAAGDCAELHFEDGKMQIEQIWYAAKRQGELAALAMLGDDVRYRPPIFFNSAKFFDIEYTTAGQVVQLPEDANEFFCRLPGESASIRIVVRNHSVIGFNMLGARWNHTWLERWIQERRTLPYVMENLHRAQFDVEFGRASLESAQAAYAEYTRRAAKDAA